MREVYMALAAFGLLSCQAGDPSPPTTAQVEAAPVQPVAAEGETEAAPAADEAAASDPPGPPQPTPPQTQELLVLDTISCAVTSAQLLVDCVHDWQALLRTPAAPAWAACTLDPVDVEAHAPVDDELWRGSFTIEALDEYGQRQRCKVGSIDARVPAAEHGIQALTNAIVADVASGATTDELGPAVDLDAGPVRAVVGEHSRRVRFLSVYLRDLGELVAVPGRELLTRDELRAALDDAFVGEWPGAWVRGARHFKPQVEDEEQRHGFGYTPIFPTCPFTSAPWPHECAFALPVLASEGRRWLIMATTPMRGPDESALTRRLLIERIVEDGLQATPEAVAYAKQRRADR